MVDGAGLLRQLAVLRVLDLSQNVGKEDTHAPPHTYQQVNPPSTVRSAPLWGREEREWKLIQYQNH